MDNIQGSVEAAVEMASDSQDNSTSTSRTFSVIKKVFNDPIHGSIELHPLCVKVIDTPQFQRLRNIKQLGGGYMVYPGAAHNRFEHSIGTCHLAGEMAKTLQQNQPELKIDDEDILCVEIAGLCHDLGHGPFSHLFDQSFIPAVFKDKGIKKKWKHEDASKDMFDYLFTDEDLETNFKEVLQDIKNKKDGKKNEHEKTSKDMSHDRMESSLEDDFKRVIQDIKDLIDGKKNEASDRWKTKPFLYEIVANEGNGIDVDKWDYFARDCHGLGIRNNFDHGRLMKFARVISVDEESQEEEPQEEKPQEEEPQEEEPQEEESQEEKPEKENRKKKIRKICYRDKEAANLYEMFHTRMNLHRRAYQHRVKKLIEEMITDALLSAEKHIIFPGKDGGSVKMSEAIDDMEAYSLMTDCIVQQILVTKGPNLEGSRNILKKIQRRELYKFVDTFRPDNKVEKDNSLRGRRHHYGGRETAQSSMETHDPLRV